MSEKARPEDSMLFGIGILVVIAGLVFGGIILIRALRTPPKPPPPAVVKCPHCGKDVNLRVVTPEDDKAAGGEPR